MLPEESIRDLLVDIQRALSLGDLELAGELIERAGGLLEQAAADAQVGAQLRWQLVTLRRAYAAAVGRELSGEG